MTRYVFFCVRASESLLVNDCYVITQIWKQKRLRFTFLLTTSRGVRTFLRVKLVWLEPDLGPRQFYCIVGLLAGWNESVSSRRPDPWSSRLLRGQSVTSKGNTARGGFYTSTNRRFCQKKNAWWHLIGYRRGRRQDTRLIRREIKTWLCRMMRSSNQVRF